MTRTRGSSFTKAPPLKEFKEPDPYTCVKTYLSEPFIKSFHKEREVGYTIAKLMLQCELFLSKGKPADSAPVQSIIRRTYDVYNMNPDELLGYLKRHNLDQLFPRSASILGSGAASNQNDYKTISKQFQLINQVLSMACQLKKDIQLTNHKYMAHQLALLYHSVNQAGANFTRFKPLIENEFDSIKSISSDNVEEPHLTVNQKIWLGNITEEIIIESLNFRKHLSAKFEDSGNPLESFFLSFKAE
jgi:hypothetical protein